MKTSFAFLLLAVLLALVTAQYNNNNKEKTGKCPKRPSNCGYVRPGPTDCSTDRECTGSKKCCDQCVMKCTPPETEVVDKVKAGKCPRRPSNCDYGNHGRSDCKTDRECTGSMKCCDQCVMKCTKPETEVVNKVKPGTCPDRPNRCNKPIRSKCRDDGDCLGAKKCCDECGGMQCKEPKTTIKEKPGKCPPNWPNCGLPLPAAKCRSDAECDGTYKCCNSCGIKCMPALPDHDVPDTHEIPNIPKTEHPGKCPRKPQYCSGSNAKPGCRDDGDCDKPKKCCDMCGGLQCTPVASAYN